MKTDPEIRFINTPRRILQNGCIEWLAGKNQQGYGRFFSYSRLVPAHRFAKEIQTGNPIRHDLVTDHLCRNTSCVNPQHLEIVTNRENVMRGLINQNAPKQFCKYGHELTQDNVYYRVRKEGWHARNCRECGKRACKEYRARKAKR